MDINKLKTQNKNLYNLTMNSLKNQNNNQDTILENEMNKSRQRKLRIEPELEKRIRVMRYFSNKNNLETDNKNNTNYQFGTKIQLEEKKLNELKQEQDLNVLRARLARIYDLMTSKKEKELEMLDNKFKGKKQELIGIQMRQINIAENANKDRAMEGSNKLTQMALKNKKESETLGN